MISAELKSLARRHDLDNERNFTLRVTFAIACVERVEHLLIDDQVLASLATGKRFVAGAVDRQALSSAAADAAARATAHEGTSSLDGSGSAAVSSSHGVAAALAGRALQAAGYTAYASVYAYASHAVTDPTAYVDEHRWQVATLIALVDRFDDRQAPPVASRHGA